MESRYLTLRYYPSFRVINDFVSMRGLFNFFWMLTKFTFKAVFWFIGILVMIVVGSYPD